MRAQPVSATHECPFCQQDHANVPACIPYQQQAFDVSASLYQACREFLSGRTACVNIEVCSEKLWRPDKLPRAAEFVADFEIVSRRALVEHDGATGRHRRLFELYFAQGMTRRWAVDCMGVGEAGFDNLLWETRRRAGEALLAAGVYPLAEYFQEPSHSPYTRGERQANK